MNEVDLQAFSLGLYELKFQVWLNSVEFRQIYWAFSFARWLLQSQLGGWPAGYESDYSDRSSFAWADQ